MEKKLNQALVFAISFALCAPTLAAPGAAAPVVRGPGVTQEQLEAFAESQNISTFTDHIDRARPGVAATSKLKKLIERAQTAWLAGSIETARDLFRELTSMAIEADWREPQREAIHYAFLRLAQSATAPAEKNQWLEKAALTFPDLAVDEDVFPPPIVDAFKTARAQVLSESKSYAPAAHFAGYRFLIVNGKRFTLQPDLRIRITKSLMRVTALSDELPVISERLTAAQLQTFQVPNAPMAAGTCAAPDLSALPKDVESIQVVYSYDCVRSRTSNGWAAKEPASDPSRELRMPDVSTPAASPAKRTWLWVGVAFVAASASYMIYKNNSRVKSTSEAAPPPATTLEPTQRSGF